MTAKEEDELGHWEALAEALPGMVAGDVVTIHDSDCDYPDRRCTCTPLVVRGPSGEA